MNKENDPRNEWKPDEASSFQFENEELDPVVGDYNDFEDEERMEAYLSDAVAQVTEEPEELEEEEIPTYREFSDIDEPTYKWSLRKKILVGLGTAVGSLGLVITIAMGWFLFSIQRDVGTTYAKSDLTQEEIEAQATLPPRDENQILLDDKIVNILLIGREGIWDGKDANGRSDSMIIASMNTEEKTLKMVSVMRDSYVSIPGYRDNKLNAAFQFGGGPLLCDTIERNFGVKLDGYVIIDFAGFKKLIDEVGGVEIELTEDEAQYLNTTNYISDKSQRNVVPGKQTVTGVQALGYCRVRKRKAINGENDDYGRTYRQRAVIAQVYEKVKDLSVTDMVSLVNKLLKYVTTDVKSSDILTYAKVVVQMGVPEIEQKRIPVDGAYSGQNLWCGSSLVLNFTENNAALWAFIYGDEHGDITTITPGEGNYASSSVVTSTADTGGSTDTDTNSYSSTYAPRATTAYTATTVIPSTTKEPVVTKKVKVTKEPVVTEDYSDFEDDDEEEVVVTEAPVVTKEPVVVTQAPAPTEAPVVITEAPAVVATAVPQAQGEEGTVG